MPVIDVCILRDAVTAEWQINRRVYRVPIRVETSSELDGPATVLAGVNRIMLSSFYQYGNDNDTGALLVGLSTPRRAGNGKLKTTWIVEALYEFDVENRPGLQGVKVEPFYLTEPEPIIRAKYRGAFTQTGETFVRKNFPNNDETYQENLVYPIGNSSYVPIIPAPERDASKPSYRVRWFQVSFYDYGPFLNTMNQTEFTLNGENERYLQPGIVQAAFPFTKTFPAETLRLRDVQQVIRTFYGADWYETTLEFVEDDRFLNELDRGVSGRAKPGDPDGRGGTYSQGDFPDGAPQTRELLDADGQPLSDPVLLDGRGRPLDTLSPGFVVYLRWEKYPVSEFNNLPIGV